VVAQTRPHTERPSIDLHLSADDLAGVYGTPKKNILAQEVADELILLDVVDGGYYGLNPVGARIWRVLAEGRSAAEVLATLLAEYNVDEPHARQDLLALLTDLSARGLLELHGLTPT
jgi:hypothetical protein